jgi:hypothetical protein
MDMKRHMLICFFHIHVGVGKKKEWGNYKTEVVIRKGGRLVIKKKFIGKGK